MSSWVRAVWAIAFMGGSLAFAQSPGVRGPQVGYGVITPASADSSGLIAVETLTHVTPGGVVETKVSPSPVLTSAAIPASIGTMADGTTGVAIVNPNVTTCNVQLSFSDPGGTEILRETISVLPHGQFARFLNEIFPPVLDGTLRGTGLLTVIADVPVAVLGLEFRDAGFAMVPLAGLSSPLPLSPFTSSTPTGTPPVAVPILGIMPVLQATSSSNTDGVATSAPVIGGAGALVFPQVASGNGWSTSFAIANTGSVSQSIRIDIYDPNGIPVRSITDVTIPSHGLYNLVH